MRRWIFRIILLIALVLYSLLVYSWWQEGTDNFEQQRRESCAEYLSDGTALDKIPAGCK